MAKMLAAPLPLIVPIFTLIYYVFIILMPSSMALFSFILFYFIFIIDDGANIEDIDTNIGIFDATTTNITIIASNNGNIGINPANIRGIKVKIGTNNAIILSINLPVGAGLI